MSKSLYTKENQWKYDVEWLAKHEQMLSLTTNPEYREKWKARIQAILDRWPGKFKNYVMPE